MKNGMSEAATRLTAAVADAACQAAQEQFDRSISLTTLYRQSLSAAYEQLFDLVCSEGDQSHRSPAFVEFLNQHSITPLLLQQSYEFLLDHHFVRTRGKFVIEKENGLRKKQGSYFTPPWLVDLLLDATLRPVLMRRIGREVFGREPTSDEPLSPLSEWTPAQREAAQETMLSLHLCDPACGPGIFLVAAARMLAEQLALLRTSDRSDKSVDEAACLVGRRCLFGVDQDPLAARIARFGLWLAAGSSDSIPVEHIRVGDSLRPPQVSQDLFGTDDGVDWLTEFAASFVRDPAGFDVVVGNPPFANAIEGLVDQPTKDRLSRDFPELVGTSDLSYYFLALGHRLARPDGSVGFILPRGVLTSRSTISLRRELRKSRPPSLIYAPQNAYLFGGANIFIVALALGGWKTCLGSREPQTPRLEAINVVDENWWAPLLGDSTARNPLRPKLKDRFEIFAGMTAGMAYDVLPFVSDQPLDDDSLRLLTTGLIDPGVSLWGKQTCRYLKKRFQTPYVNETQGFPVNVANRLAKVRRPKVIVAGLSNRVEAFLDAEGEYCGAVSTYAIIHPKDNPEQLRWICDYLNSDPVAEELNRQLGAHAMGGGRITLSKSFLQNLPLP